MCTRNALIFRSPEERSNYGWEKTYDVVFPLISNISQVGVLPTAVVSTVKLHGDFTSDGYLDAD